MTDLHTAKGIIYGLAIGDALGYPTEFMSLERIKASYGPEGIQDLPESGVFSDDTQMSIAIAEALDRAGGEDIDSIMQAVKEEFLRWYESPENIRAPGRTCLAGIASMKKGASWRESGIPTSKGCGSAIRVAPVGYLYQSHPQRLREVAHACGVCTHTHPTADASCIGAAYLVKLALDGTPPENMISEMLSFTAGMSTEFDAAILKTKECLDWKDEERALSFLGAGWLCEESVALALYCFLRYPHDYKKVVLRAANTDGDSDSIACIAGSISGAYLGIDAIPQAWINRIEKSAYLDTLARRLAAKKAEI